MNKSAMIAVRVEPELKSQVESTLNVIGLNIAQAVNVFFRYVVREKGIPFDVKVSPKVKASPGPNEVSRKEMVPAQVQQATVLVRGLDGRMIHVIHADLPPFVVPTIS